MTIYRIISIPVSIPYAIDGKTGITTKLCVCAVDDSGAPKNLRVFKVCSDCIKKIPPVTSLTSLVFDEYGRINGFGVVSAGDKVSIEERRKP